MIYINGAPLPHQPSTLDESPDIVKTDQYAIRGNVQRNSGPPRKHIRMSWAFVRPEMLNLIDDLVNTHAPVAYKNDNSPRYGTLEFQGIITPSTSAYARGSSGLTPLSIDIVEGESFGL